MKPVYRYAVLCWLLITAGIAQAQVRRDTAFIAGFDRENTIEAYPGYYTTRFSFEGYGKRPAAFRLTANSNAYTGFFINYKWLSFQYAWGIPGTELAKGIRLKHASFSFRYNRPRVSFYPFFDGYDGLLLRTAKRHPRFDSFRGMQLFRAGVRTYYFTNTEHYTYRAGLSFAERQLRPAGGFIFNMIPQWQQINWKTPSRALIRDSVTYRLLASDPQWISLVAGGGYNYNWVFNRGAWIVSPAVIGGIGGLRELNNARSVQPMLNLQAWVNAGYSGPVFYAYINGSIQASQTHLIVRKLNTMDDEVSLTLGYRFKGHSKKILGML
ncbi:DUF4421 family protein [Niabella drilacis]|uniref:DUF4421 domain-containing protein n=1 Tax=Niabella drilacis (strain DSM 25811 / CCM 8410 / CCUG 62505 / LMG 26954 / E90) TaxID=1285928 RepID=A0A1G7AHG2_NIADE|nr:DUF4421 family protein [Niabella drilacis]SDE14160.1 protein of unknown function [Niabella drilacis]